MFYDDNKPYFDTLKWDDIFTSAAQFISSVVDIGGVTDTDDLTELYEVLSNKYLFAHTRYTTPDPFIFALKRELYTEFPFYIEKKQLASDMIATTLAELQRGQRQLRNLVDQHDETYTNLDTVPINDLSTQQENVEITNNKLEALKMKYNVMNRNFLAGIYQRCDQLFRVILAKDEITLFESEE